MWRNISQTFKVFKILKVSSSTTIAPFRYNFVKFITISHDLPKNNQAVISFIESCNKIFQAVISFFDGCNNILEAVISFLNECNKIS